MKLFTSSEVYLPGAGSKTSLTNYLQVASSNRNTFSTVRRQGWKEKLPGESLRMRNFSPWEDRDGELSPNGKFTVHIPKSAATKHADARPHKLTVSATKL